ncbi:hypothetical protein BWI15_33805 [Kribbella sp. ALI-6-A]|uniref:hypothetical protein n=1 Tax=Kribbella sp. ALI-6-A TaxID=1933817 RepID=UPI00097CBBDF|nr:hypothetical protein [Kribbella sp. ALI-6-A]ONI68031.1 hypothetical protein BWI15_33805 [Kribbella sp. ALI-6-A]
MIKLLRRASALALAAVVLVLPTTAWGATPADPRIAAAVAAWKDQPVYVDPQYLSQYGDDQLDAMRARIATMDVPVYVAVVPTGAWFQEKGDTALLAGWLAAANGKPGIYVVMDDYLTTGVEHLVPVYAPARGYGRSKEPKSQQLSSYLDEVETGDRYKAKPARTVPLPPREERDSPPERFTVGKAIGNGIGGAVLGLMGGALLAGIVLGLAALVAGRRGGRP